MDYRVKKRGFFRHALSVPFIWAMIIPLFILDIGIEIYHRVCFYLYAIPYVERSKYIYIDRHKLSYLNLYEKVNCTYCGYGNGLLNYSAEIAARTEKYWCGIKHKETKGKFVPKHHDDFVKYGDKKEFEKRYGR